MAQEMTDAQSEAADIIANRLSRIFSKDAETHMQPIVDAITDPVVRADAQRLVDNVIEARERARSK